MYTDVESDHINPIDFCKQVNKIVLPEMGLHLALTVIFFLSFSWAALLINIPLAVYNANKYVNPIHS